jgi:hypothetical protein
VWGWFDVGDGRDWPEAGEVEHHPVGLTDPKPGDIAGPYEAKGFVGQPQGLTLEKLRLRFEDNIYFAAPGQGWFEWGVTWGRHKIYSNLTEFQTDLRIDTGSRVWEPAFADLIALDLRLSREAMERVDQNYPQGPVPGILLGVKP